MSELLERLGVELPVVQAGMGGGLAGAELAAAVSEAGGLGTLGMVDPGPLEAALRAARAATGRPLAVNLLLPFARAAHWRAAASADAVVTFWGAPRRRTAGVWLHQCGSVAEALAARAAGADGVIVQGREAGGHVRGEAGALELLARAREALPDFPLLLAGGIADAADVAAAVEAGADAAVLGTRFLLSDESGAHPEYKRRLLAARDTILTDLFGLAWPAPHRVVRNAATERWLRSGGRPPAAVRVLNRLSAPLSRMPLPQAGLPRPRVGVPLLSPAAPTRGWPASAVDAAPLYAGETVARIGELRPAGELVGELAAAVTAGART